MKIHYLVLLVSIVFKGKFKAPVRIYTDVHVQLQPLSYLPKKKKHLKLNIK